MQYSQRIRLWASASIVALMQAACGGGGGGGGEAPGQTTPNITLRSSGGLFAANVAVGSTLPAQMVSGTATGDANALSGRTVYVVVEDPAGLFAPSGHTVSVDANGNFFVTLQGRTITFTGRRTGTFQVRACLDAQCGVQLNGSPLSYPYEVVAAEPLTVTSNTIRMSRRFGEGGATTAPLLSTFPPNATFTIDRAPQYDGALDATFDFQHVLIGFDGQLNAAAGTHTGTIQTRAAAPGTYVADIRLRASVPGKQNLPFQQDQSVRVEYEVVDDPAIAAAFHPANVVVDVSGAGCSVDPPVRFLALLRTGDRLDVARVEYLSEPASAPGHPFASAWLDFDPGFTVPRIRSCYGGDPSGPRALPAGVYEARIVYRVTRASGATAEVALPIRYLR